MCVFGALRQKGKLIMCTVQQLASLAWARVCLGINKELLDTVGAFC